MDTVIEAVVAPVDHKYEFAADEVSVVVFPAQIVVFPPATVIVATALLTAVVTVVTGLAAEHPLELMMVTE